MDRAAVQELESRAVGRGGFRLTGPALALVVGALAVALLAAAIPLAAFARQVSASLFPFVFVPFAGVGVIVAYRQSRNPIGWILMLVSLGEIISFDASAYAVRAYRIDHHGLLLSRLAVVLAAGWIAFVLLPLPILLFPDGRVRGRGWRVTLWVYVALAAMITVTIAVKDVGAFTHRHVTVDSSGELVTGAAGAAVKAVGGVALVLMVLIALSWVIQQLVRYHRSTGVERQQLKWLIAGGVVCVAGFLISAILSSIGTEPWQTLSGIGPFAIAALPLAIGVGILRYRLYDIDRLISRTISYTLLTAMLAGVFVGIVVLMTDVVPLSSPVAVAASTLAAAALFNPLRKRTQRLIDRRFNRARYDAQATIAAFNGRLRDALELDAISNELLRVVNETMSPAHTSFWVRPPASQPRHP